MSFPLNMPYQADIVLEKVNGELYLNGEHYAYIMRQVKNDTLKLFCVRNSAKASVQQRASEYSGKVNGLPGNSSSKKTENNKVPVFEFEEASYAGDNYRQQQPYLFNAFINIALPKLFICPGEYPPEV